MRKLLFPWLVVLVSAAPVESQDRNPIGLIEAPGILSLGKGLKVGYSYERVSKTGRHRSRERCAVVGETKDAWLIETNEGLRGLAHFKDSLLLALVVDKKTHEVLIAKVGQPGGALEEVKILACPPGPRVDLLSLPSPKPSKQIDLKLPSGKAVKADVYEDVRQAGVTSFVGAKGTRLAGVVLRLEGKDGRGLTEDPKDVRFPLREKDAKGKVVVINATSATYSNGWTMIFAEHPVLRAFRQDTLGFRSAQGESTIVSLRTDAKPRLNWN